MIIIKKMEVAGKRHLAFYFITVFLKLAFEIILAKGGVIESGILSLYHE